MLKIYIYRHNNEYNNFNIVNINIKKYLCYKKK
jgi:hypothetical protein